MSELQRPLQSDDERFAASVKRLREEKGWSQGELARRMSEAGFEGFHQTTISRIEKNERPVRIGEARGLAKVFDTLVGIMIAPAEQWKVVDAFGREVIALANAESAVGHAVRDYMHQRVMAKKALEDLRALGPTESLEEGLQANVAMYEAKVANLLNRSYSDAIDDALDPSGSIRAEAEDAKE